QPTPPAQPSRRSESRPASGLDGLLSSLFNLIRGDGKKPRVEERTPRTASSQNSAPRPPTSAQSGAPRVPGNARTEPDGVLPAAESRSSRAELPQVLTAPLSTYPPAPAISAAAPNVPVTPAPDVDRAASMESPARVPGWKQVPFATQPSPSAQALLGSVG